MQKCFACFQAPTVWKQVNQNWNCVISFNKKQAGTFKSRSADSAGQGNLVSCRQSEEWLNWMGSTALKSLRLGSENSTLSPRYMTLLFYAYLWEMKGKFSAFQAFGCSSQSNRLFKGMRENCTSGKQQVYRSVLWNSKRPNALLTQISRIILECIIRSI